MNLKNLPVSSPITATVTGMCGRASQYMNAGSPNSGLFLLCQDKFLSSTRLFAPGEFGVHPDEIPSPPVSCYQASAIHICQDSWCF